MFNSVQFLFDTFTLNLGKFSMPVTYWEAGSIIFLIFLLILTMAQFRKHYVDWSLKGGVFGIFFGFALALILEGFLLIGGKTVLTSTLGWKNPPAPLAQALDAGRNQLIQVLGVHTQVPAASLNYSVSVRNAVQIIQGLNPKDLKSVKNIICAP